MSSKKAFGRSSTISTMPKSPNALGVVLLVSMLTHVGCARPAPTQAAAAQPPETPELLATGQRLYEKQCAVCHGAQGAGDGPAAYLLYPKPRDFTQNEFRLVSTSSMQATNEDLFRTITRGMPGSAMPSWEALTPRERWALVYYVRRLTKTAEPIDPAAVIQVPPETAATPEGMARGREIFVQACASCHGPLGKGDGQRAMTDNAGFPVRPRDLTAGIFKGSSESRDLYYRIAAGLPGSPMPSYAGAYADEQIWDLVHYVRSLIPPGVEERVRLRHQTILARRVRGEIPSDPSAESWNAAPSVSVAVTPLWWRNQRIERIEVRALHNGSELAVRLAWDDPTLDDSTLRPQSFSDGVAVQFSLESDPPFFGMGAAGAPVQIWHWKAAWQQDQQGWRDVDQAYPALAVDGYPAAQDPQFMSGWGAGNPLSDARHPRAAEEADAQGLGTLTSRAPEFQQVQAAGVWHAGRWTVVLRGPMASAAQDGLRLKTGSSAQVAFAVWDGHAQDRNGQKSVSIWNTLQLER